MSVARRGESGVASASSNWRLRQRQIQSSCWAAAATRRCWAAAARASRFCWAAEATRRRWAGAARANRDSAVSSGPIISRAAKPPIATTTRTTAIPIANISYNNIISPPRWLWVYAQRENAKPHRRGQRDGHELKPNGSLLSRALNTLTLCRVPDTEKIFGEGGLRALRRP